MKDDSERPIPAGRLGPPGRGAAMRRGPTSRPVLPPGGRAAALRAAGRRVTSLVAAAARGLADVVETKREIIKRHGEKD